MGSILSLLGVSDFDPGGVANPMGGVAQLGDRAFQKLLLNMSKRIMRLGVDPTEAIDTSVKALRKVPRAESLTDVADAIMMLEDALPGGGARSIKESGAFDDIFSIMTGFAQKSGIDPARNTTKFLDVLEKSPEMRKTSSDLAESLEGILFDITRKQ